MAHKFQYSQIDYNSAKNYSYAYFETVQLKFEAFYSQPHNLYAKAELDAAIVDFSTALNQMHSLSAVLDTPPSSSKLAIACHSLP